MPRVHYVGTAGVHGYLPNYCDVYLSLESAVDDLAIIHELGRQRTQELRKNLYIELNLRRDGNEYTEIIECNCNEPADHQDDLTQERFHRENPEFYEERENEE